MGSKLPADFFNRSAVDLSTSLLGKIMVRKIDGQLRRARLVEIEAYLGPKDLACHASKGLTNRTQTLFGPYGHAYVYFIYGIYYLINVVANVPGNAALLRAALPLDEWDEDLSGPGKLARAFGIGRSVNGISLWGDDIYFEDDPGYIARPVRTPRIGVDYAKHWKGRLLRFIDANSPLAPKLKDFRQARHMIWPAKSPRSGLPD